MRSAFLTVALIAVTGTANAQFLNDPPPTGELSPEPGFQREPVVPKSVLTNPGAVPPPAPPPSNPLPSSTSLTPGVRPPSLAIPPFD
jgi:hypothetical protein